MSLTLNGPPDIINQGNLEPTGHKRPSADARIGQNQIVFCLLQSLHELLFFKHPTNHFTHPFMELCKLVHNYLPQLNTGPEARPAGVPTLQQDVQLLRQIGVKVLCESIRAGNGDRGVDGRLFTDVPAIRRPDHSDLVAFGVQFLNENLHVYPVASIQWEHQYFPS